MNKKEQYYEKALEEIENKNYIKSIYAKAIRYSEGDDSKIKSLYIKHRVDSLLEEYEEYYPKRQKGIHRLFKLIYAILFTGLFIFIPIYFGIDSSEGSYGMTNYKVKCMDNNEYVVYQGNKLDNHATVTKDYLHSTTFGNNLQQLNFYCKFSDEIKVHIDRYLNATTGNEITSANLDYFKFKKSKIDSVLSYPKLFVLEKQYDDRFWNYAVIHPAIDALVYGFVYFLLLQILKGFYTYIVFGSFTFHPFRITSKKRPKKD